jgi:DNA invertase Pin-like site-specific DNA recombinase
VAYIRVSTKEQDEEVQRRALEEFAGGHGVEIMEWYVDKGESGAVPFKSRPVASKLIEDLGKLKPECVLSWSIDRLGRSMLDTMNTILELESRGVRVITVKEEFLQTLDPNIRKLILSILSWIAEYERRRIRERQEEAWKHGKQKGRPPKVSDHVIKQYYKQYVVERGLSVRDVWKIMRADGHDISYDRLLKRIKMMVKRGEIVVKREVA